MTTFGPEPANKHTYKPLFMEVVTNLQDNPEKNKRTPEKELADKAAKIYREKGLEAMQAFLDQEAERRKKTPAQTDDTPAAPHPRNPSPNPVPDIVDGAEPLSDTIEKVIRKAPVNKNNLPTVKVENFQDTIKILQPKSVVFGRYHLTEWQEDIMTLIMQQLQGYMSRSLNLLKPDFLGEISVRIDCREIAGDDKKKALQQIEKMMNYKFEFWWQNELAPAGTKKIETKGIVISTYHNYIGTSYVDLTINKWAIPFLLYYGPGVGANQYSKEIALSLPGKYTKRIYKTLSGYIDKGRFDFRIDEMRREYMLPDSYTNAQIKRSIVMPSVETINTYYPDIHVSAEFITLNKKTDGKKPTMDTVRFTIEKKGAQQKEYVPEQQMAAKVIAFLTPLLQEPYKSNIHAFTQKWRQHGDLGFVYAKIEYYEKMVQTGKMTPAKMKNYLLKAISDETHIQLRKTGRRKIQEF